MKPRQDASLRFDDTKEGEGVRKKLSIVLIAVNCFNIVSFPLAIFLNGNFAGAFLDEFFLYAYYVGLLAGLALFIAWRLISLKRRREKIAWPLRILLAVTTIAAIYVFTLSIGTYAWYTPVSAPTNPLSMEAHL